MSVVGLMGPPGSGKTLMMCRTANHPIHVIDVDRKISTQVDLVQFLESKKVTFWEVGFALGEEALKERIAELVNGKKPQRPPRGWLSYADLVGRLETDPISRKAATWGIDSFTRVAEHKRAYMSFLGDKSKFTWNLWAAWASAWKEHMTILVDAVRSIAKDGCLLEPSKVPPKTECEHGCSAKDLIVTVHERAGEVPSDSTTGVILHRGEKGDIQREYLGVLEPRIWPSIDGQFGGLMPSYFDEFYQLYVDVDRDGRPTWRCRVLPDKRRDLRTSHNTGGRAVFPPDFQVIWGKRKEAEEVRPLGQKSLQHP